MAFEIPQSEATTLAARLHNTSSKLVLDDIAKHPASWVALCAARRSLSDRIDLLLFEHVILVSRPTTLAAWQTNRRPCDWPHSSFFEDGPFVLFSPICGWLPGIGPTLFGGNAPTVARTGEYLAIKHRAAELLKHTKTLDIRGVFPKDNWLAKACTNMTTMRVWSTWHGSHPWLAVSKRGTVVVIPAIKHDGQVEFCSLDRSARPSPRRVVSHVRWLPDKGPYFSGWNWYKSKEVREVVFLCDDWAMSARAKAEVHGAVRDEVPPFGLGCPYDWSPYCRTPLRKAIESLALEIVNAMTEAGSGTISCVIVNFPQVIPGQSLHAAFVQQLKFQRSMLAGYLPFEPHWEFDHRLRFLSREEYRASVSSEQWSLEMGRYPDYCSGPIAVDATMEQLVTTVQLDSLRNVNGASLSEGLVNQ